MLLQDLKEFSQETSIHGLGQIADDAATKTKRFIWIIIFVGSLTYAGVMLHDAYQGGYIFQIIWLNPNWHEAGHFYPPCNFGIGFCLLNLYQKFPNFF